MRYGAAVLGLLLCWAPLAHAGLWPRWGPPRRDLRLGILQGKVGAKQRTLEIYFVFKNVGRTPVVVTEKMSCGGHEGFALELTLKPVLARRHPVVVEPPPVECDKNYPVLRTIKPKQMLTSIVTFRLPPGVVVGEYQVMGRVRLRVEGKSGPVELTSMSLQVDLRRLAK